MTHKDVLWIKFALAVIWVMLVIVNIRLAIINPLF
jgi:hypothetical protein